MKRIKQISIFVENKPGRLLDVVEILGNSNIDIKAISLADSSDFGIVRLICENPESAYEVMNNSGFTASLTEVLAIAISDKPGSLAKVLRALKESDVNIEYMYGFSAKTKDHAVMIIKVSNLEETIKCCISNNVQVLSENDISSIV
jgi:hypothetical protein